MKNICLLITSILCVFGGLASAHAQQNTPYWSGTPNQEVPIKDLTLKGISLQMSVGAIVKTLEGQGYTAFQNAHGYRIAKEGGADVFQVHVKGNLRTGQSFQSTDHPHMIMYNVVNQHRNAPNGTQASCPSVQNMIDKICHKGKNERPCFTRGSRTMAQITNQHSNDFANIYSVKAEVDIGQLHAHCTVTLGAKNTGLPQF